MNILFKSFLLVAFLSAQATPALAKDPCKTVLCMAGMLQGKGTVSGCSGPVSDFFNIVKKKKGKFKPDATQDARREFVNQCPAAGNWGNKIADKYGRILM
ncbi:TrbM/KikA/MpfK family conjugal transfer protein [Pseudomonas helleri]|uniref:TrbM/KikA/MpfK family conjugal transfer protein n=1 Tax=Pseudomonas helleri TaxID=1608996 RepID=UPI003FD5837F